MRAEIDASALGWFPRRIHDLPVKAAKLLSPLPPPRRNGMLRKQVRWQLLSDCHLPSRRGRLAVEIRFGLDVSSDERQSPRQSRFSRDHLCWRRLDCRWYDLDGIRSLHRYRHGDYCCRVDQFHGRVSQQDALTGPHSVLEGRQRSGQWAIPLRLGRWPWTLTRQGGCSETSPHGPARSPGGFLWDCCPAVITSLTRIIPKPSK